MSYAKIQEYVKGKYGFTPKTCWIADAKEKCGLEVKRACNRAEKQRKNPCPESKFPAIKEALEDLGMLGKYA